ncbi:tRNA 2-thiouridine(34) synthase MnmA [Bacteroides reticulotermitis]|uniref:tRNA 2-thiouridine(34) synthase MnmA n=1 Tax=Bacteroides reticulotermitis TaxID=1133319 RepID=UPI003A846C5C
MAVGRSTCRQALAEEGELVKRNLMEDNKKIAALLSGGVDSSVVVHLLCEQGYKPSLFYIKIGMDGADYMDCSAEEDIELATATARKYGLPLEIIDLHREYWDNVAAYAIDKIRKGLTPNPDVMCNKLIKFGCFEQKVGKDFDFTATGHYATTQIRDGKTWLATAKDPLKDQTDFLAQIDALQVSKLMFPIGHLMKQEVRQLAVSAALPSARRKDSQGICFLGKINYNDFVRRFLGEKEGPIIELETGKKVGTHHGYWFHTIGQRKGLGLSGGPWFVIKKDVEANIIYVSHGYGVETQYGNEFRFEDFHFITENPWGDRTSEVDITFKIRHTPEFAKGKLIREDNGYRILSSEKLQGIAPGQFGVIYDEASELCIGSGEITI